MQEYIFFFFNQIRISTLSHAGFKSPLSMKRELKKTVSVSLSAARSFFSFFDLLAPLRFVMQIVKAEWDISAIEDANEVISRKEDPGKIVLTM